MCTATWWSDAGRYELFFSRDERLDRSAGLAPMEYEHEGVRYLCPRDPDGGGTWLLVNEYALTLCLLNQYPQQPAPVKQPRISRGRLVESLAACQSPDVTSRVLQGQDLRHYEGFLLLAVGLHGARRFRWDTRQLTMEADARLQPLLTSSSFMSDDVLLTRQHLFEQMVAAHGDPSPQKLDAFHRHFMPDASTHSVFMQRPDSQTVSLCQVAVSPERISLAYSPKHPVEPRFLAAQVNALTPRA